MKKKKNNGEIPQGWESLSLSDINLGVGISIQPFNYPEELFEYYSIPAFQENKGKPYYTLGSEIKSNKLVIQNKDVLFGKLNPSKPKVWLVDSESPLKKISSTEFLGVRPNTALGTPSYIYQFLQSSWFTSKMEALAAGSTNSHQRVNPSSFYKTEILLPPLLEQQKIADILSTVDEKIRVIDQQITETGKLKKGLMQRLLVLGIGHTEFKDSPLGKIPGCWGVKLLDNCAKRGSGHTPDKKVSAYYNGGIKWVSLGDSNKLDNRYISNTKNIISREGLQNSSAVLHSKGTVLLSRDAGVGKSAVMKEDMAVSQHFITWNCDKAILNNWFLYYLLQYQKPLFERIAIGSTIKTIGLDFFKKMKIALPPLQEQAKIADILFTLDDKIEILQNKNHEFEALKRGLMQNLLTGKIRINTPVEA